MERTFMKNFFILTLFTILSLNSYADSFYDFKFNDTNGNPILLKSFKGKEVLLVNVATRCGFTGQLDDLEKLNLKFKDKNLIILGVPSNNFLSQTPEDNKDVGNFCRLKYGVTFPILEKQEVIGDKKSNLYKWVNSQKGYEGNILWNFEKFLINKDGRIVKRFRSATSPSDQDFLTAVEKYL